MKTKFRYLMSIVGSMIISVAIFSSCNKGVKKTEPAETISIAALKQKAAQLVNKQDSAARQYILQGYFVNETVPMLVTNMKWMRINTVMPDSVFVILNGPGIDSVSKNPSYY